MNNLFPFILILLIPGFLSTIFTPYWTRKTESFGVTIPQKIYNSPELKKLRKQYVLYSSFTAIIITILLFFLSSNTSELTASIQLTVAIFLYLGLSFIIYLKFHADMKKMKQSSNWNKGKSQQLFINTNFHSEKLTYSNLWFLISFVVTFIIIFFTFENYHLLPEQLPIQYGFSGEVTSWADKSYRSAFLFPVMTLYMTFLFLFVNTVIARSKQQIDSENPEESLKQNAIFRKRWSLFIIIGGTALTLLFSFIQLTFFYAVNPSFIMFVVLFFTLLIIGGAIYLSFTTGQGGSRVKHETVDSNGKSINRDDDRYWKLGIFYFNKGDPALFLEKRFGVGWTINLARPLAWIIFLVIIGSSIALPLLLI